MKKQFKFLYTVMFVLLLFGCDKTKSFDLSVEGHTHDCGDWIDEVKATCGTEGIRGHYHCDVCNKDFNDDYEELNNLSTKPTGKHKLSVIEGVLPTCYESGYESYFLCDVCGKKFVYTDEPIYMSIGGDVLEPFSNWGGDTIYIEGDGTNAYAKLSGSGFPIWTQIDKNLSTNLLQDGKYTIEFDVKLSQEAYDGVHPTNGYKGSIHLRLNYPGSDNHYISQVNGSLGLCNTEDWTTLSFDYEISGLSSKNGVSLSIIYWLEGSNIDNYILIDNIKIYEQGDLEKKNLDINVGGDFEGYLGYFEIENETILNQLTHEYVWVIDKAATLEETGLKHQECVLCKDVQNEGAVIDVVDCLHTEIVKVRQENPTCVSDGKEEHYQCIKCLRCFEDSELNVLIEDFTNWGIIPKIETHELRYVDETNEYISHLSCIYCDKDFLCESGEISLPSQSQWSSYPIGNFTDAKSYIISDGVNAYFKFEPVNWGELTGMTKDMGAKLIEPGTYVISLDVMARGNLVAVSAGKLDIHFNYYGGFIKVSDGVFNLSTIKDDEWTRLEFTFLVPEGIESDWSNFTFYYWAEISLENNSLLMDNLVVYEKNDTNKNNLDEYGFGSFENFFEIKELTLEDKKKNEN